MRTNAGFTPQQGAHISDSALCATCHNLMTPVLDNTGQVIPDREFPEQAVYTEWQNSAFADGRAEATSCQQCHMARTDGVKIANRPRNLPKRNDFGRHGFYGGNTLMLDILSANRAALDVGAGDFAASIEATRANLRSAADLGIEEATLDATKNELLIRVRVTNNTGHKLPTSYPSRRIYVHLKVSDPAGTTLFESGRLRPATGQVIGVNADIGAGFEPHQRGEITRAAQVQVYEAIMGDSDGNLTYTLLRASDSNIRLDDVVGADQTKREAIDSMNLFLASYRFNRPVMEVASASLPLLGLRAIGVLLVTYVPWLTLGLLALF